jgi:hypothetical protein
MRDGVIQHASSVRAPKSLAARGGLARTFGGLAGFVVVTFLCGGFYMLQDAFAHPLNEGATAVMCAAFMITLAAALLFFLIRPMKGPRTTGPLHSAGAVARGVRPGFHQAPRTARQERSRNNLAYQRTYVDHSLIRP